MNKYTAEFYGTFLLLLAIVSTEMLMRSIDAPPYLTLLTIAASASAILYCNITLFMKVSGSHFNPAVSLMMYIRGNLSLRDFSYYTLMQILGGVMGVFAAHLMFAEPAFSISVIDRSANNIILGEFIATIGLLIVIIHGDRFSPDKLPALVGTYILAATFFTSSTCFANPAVSISRIFTNSPVGIDAASLVCFLLVEFLAVSIVSKSIE